MVQQHSFNKYVQKFIAVYIKPKLILTRTKQIRILFTFMLYITENSVVTHESVSSSFMLSDINAGDKNVGQSNTTGTVSTV